MADVRALLKAKRQEAKITHPLASYKNGRLKCFACGTPVKHASAWEGHLGSKAHRTNVVRLRDEEKLKGAQREKEEREQLEQLARGKRKAEEQDSESESDEGETKKRKLGDAAAGFPTDFFSDPSVRGAQLPPDSDEEEEEDMVVNPPLPVARSAIDLEYEHFQRELLEAPDHRETYERATVFAEPEAAPEVPEGFPQEEEVASEVPSKVSQEEARRRKEQEERELIMDRLLDEERAQEEADMKVSVMKSKLEALKKKREAAKAAKTKASS